jgi:hypothetical protein
LKYYYPTNDLVTAPEILFFWVARMIMAGLEYCGDVPFKDVTPKPSWGQRALSFAKGLGKKGTGLAVAAAGALGLGGLVAAFSGKDIKMDPADLAELQKHLKVLDQYGKDPAVKGGLPADVQKRLDGVLVKLDKLKKVQGAAPAAAPGTAPAPAAGGGNTMDGF